MHPDLQFYIYVIERKTKTRIIVIEGVLQAHTQFQKNLFFEGFIILYHEHLIKFLIYVNIFFLYRQ